MIRIKDLLGKQIVFERDIEPVQLDEFLEECFEESQCMQNKGDPDFLDMCCIHCKHCDKTIFYSKDELDYGKCVDLYQISLQCLSNVCPDEKGYETHNTEREIDISIIDLEEQNGKGKWS